MSPCTSLRSVSDSSSPLNDLPQLDSDSAPAKPETSYSYSYAESSEPECASWSRLIWFIICCMVNLVLNPLIVLTAGSEARLIFSGLSLKLLPDTPALELGFLLVVVAVCFCFLLAIAVAWPLAKSTTGPFDFSYTGRLCFFFRGGDPSDLQTESSSSEISSMISLPMIPGCYMLPPLFSFPLV